MGALPILEVQADAASGRRTDEIMGRARVEESHELIVADGDVELHGVFGTDADDRVQRD